MRTFSVVGERDADTGLFVGHVPGWPGAHKQGDTLDELHTNLQEVISVLQTDTEQNLSEVRLRTVESNTAP